MTHLNPNDQDLVLKTHDALTCPFRVPRKKITGAIKCCEADPQNLVRPGKLCDSGIVERFTHNVSNMLPGHLLFCVS